MQEHLVRSGTLTTASLGAHRDHLVSLVTCCSYAPVECSHDRAENETDEHTGLSGRELRGGR